MVKNMFYEVKITDLKNATLWANAVFNDEASAHAWILKHKNQKTWGTVEGIDYAIVLNDITEHIAQKNILLEQQKHAMNSILQRLKTLDTSKNLNNQEICTVLKDIVELLLHKL